MVDVGRGGGSRGEAERAEGLGRGSGGRAAGVGVIREGSFGQVSC
jgi:hypothetical protein